MLFGSGNSLHEEKEKIQEYIEQNNPLVIALNFVPMDYRYDYVFSCHMRRYKEIHDIKGGIKIVTSNLRETVNYQYMVNFASYTAHAPEIMENSGVMCVNLLIHLGVKCVHLAGLDGYDTERRRNYVNSGLEYEFPAEVAELRNQLIKKEFQQKRGEIKLVFLTKSVYTP